MDILLVTFRLRAPWCKSLKDKRSVVKALLSKLKKHNVSVCETGEQDEIQYIELSAAAIVPNRAQGDSTAEMLESCVSRATDSELYEVAREYR